MRSENVQRAVIHGHSTKQRVADNQKIAYERWQSGDRLRCNTAIGYSQNRTNGVGRVHTGGGSVRHFCAVGSTPLSDARASWSQLAMPTLLPAMATMPMPTVAGNQYGTGGDRSR